MTVKPGSCSVADYLYNEVCCMDCIKDQRTVHFMIEPLSTKADESPVMGGTQN